MSPYHHGDLPATLLSAAETILERSGIAALTMRAAAREAGVSHAAPAHHFGDLSGLLSELAASGFIRFHDYVAAQTADASRLPGGRVRALSRGYIGFAQAHPGLFQLMFRSERLDWSRASLASAGASAFALLTLPVEETADFAPQTDLERLAAAMARWSFAHGMAVLLIDGRIDAIATKIPGTDVEALIEEMLKGIGRGP
jgi:AcrR family transcriptional regulator